MRLFLCLLLALPALSQTPPSAAAAATPPPSTKEGLVSPDISPEEFKVYTEHPRLLLNSRRLRLLRRERDRKSPRWEQFQSLMTGGASMPERGFALALYAVVSEDPAQAKQAIQWALGPASDLRQLAFVYDWCQPNLTESQEKALAAKLVQGIERESKSDSVSSIRSRALAAIALADHVPNITESTLRTIWTSWWMGKIVPAIRKNRNAFPLADSYALLELMHAIKDNLNFDMRDNALAFFRDFPNHRVISYYPATFPAADNFYHIAQYSGLGEPDLTQAAFNRAADLSIVAYDPNALAHQFLQGWLIQDRFIMRGALGSPYEFLWANPYQPGLSYHHLPTFFHDPTSGILILRSDWEESATWLSYNRGDMELFMDGKRSGLQPRAIKEPLEIGQNMVVVGENPMQLTLNLAEPTRYFLIGLKPTTNYEIEVDDEELAELATDAGGVLAIVFPQTTGTGFRLRESHFQSK
ncbi:MAG: hypothetical protein JST93_01830 [Acidobacteria bacterium]|nr:hypothetical protein [Acidobacteriota bacterium]